MDKWKPGTFSTEALKKRLEELLALVAERAKADQQAGRMSCADNLEELPIVLNEYIRLTENVINAQKACLRVRQRSG